jgi:hypothetical protein
MPFVPNFRLELCPRIKLNLLVRTSSGKPGAYLPFTKTRHSLDSHSRRMGPLNTQAAAITTQTAKTEFSDSISEQTQTPAESFAPGTRGVN